MLVSLSCVTSLENARRSVHAGQCVSALRALEVPVFVCIHSNRSHVSGVGVERCAWIGGGGQVSYFVDGVLTQMINTSMLLRQGSDIPCSSWISNFQGQPVKRGLYISLIRWHTY